jgi:hypothetical protein
MSDCRPNDRVLEAQQGRLVHDTRTMASPALIDVLALRYRQELFSRIAQPFTFYVRLLHLQPVTNGLPKSAFFIRNPTLVVVWY